jgi:2,5-diketo-D-gluconate reductase A
VNQVQLHPRNQQAALRAFDTAQGVITESWSPLGRGQVLGDPVITRIARAHGKTAAQVVIRWHLDLGLMVIPKTVTPARLAENFDVFDFTLTAEDHTAIAALDAA